MATERNKHGLSSHIPEEIKRKIRRASRFGCVICGNGIGTYEHIEPEFHDAKSHDPACMAYLCGGCHLKVTKGFWSKERVWNARAQPWCQLHGKPHEAFDIGRARVAVWLGGNKISEYPTILQIIDDPVLRIDPPEEDGAPYYISGKFFDRADNLIFSIERNEWIGEPSAWDIECVGPRVVVRYAPGQIALQICAVPPFGVVIEKADYVHKGVQVKGDATSLSVVRRTGTAATITGRSITGRGGEDSAFLTVNEDNFKLGAGTIAPLTAEWPKMPPVRSAHVGRNEPCPCGSGRKAKKYHYP